MARTAIATLQTAWDCRWSRPTFHLDSGPGVKRLENAWVCVRDGQQQTIDPHDCESCPFWELEERRDAAAAGSTIEANDAGAPSTRVDRILYVATWMLIVMAATLFFAVGLSILTTPLALPITLTLWLMAAAVIGFALTGRVPRAH